MRDDFSTHRSSALFEDNKHRLYQLAAALLADHTDDPYYLARVLTLAARPVAAHTKQRVLFALEDIIRKQSAELLQGNAATLARAGNVDTRLSTISPTTVAAMAAMDDRSSDVPSRQDVRHLNAPDLQSSLSQVQDYPIELDSQLHDRHSLPWLGQQERLIVEDVLRDAMEDMADDKTQQDHDDTDLDDKPVDTYIPYSVNAEITDSRHLDYALLPKDRKTALHQKLKSDRDKLRMEQQQLKNMISDLKNHLTTLENTHDSTHSHIPTTHTTISPPLSSTIRNTERKQAWNSELEDQINDSDLNAKLLARLDFTDNNETRTHVSDTRDKRVLDRKKRIDLQLAREAKLDDCLAVIDADIDSGYLNSGAIARAIDVIIGLSGESTYSSESLDDIKSFLGDVLLKRLAQTSTTFVAFGIILDETLAQYHDKPVDNALVYNQLLRDTNALMVEVLVLAQCDSGNGKLQWVDDNRIEGDNELVEKDEDEEEDEEDEDEDEQSEATELEIEQDYHKRSISFNNSTLTRPTLDQSTLDALDPSIIGRHTHLPRESNPDDDTMDTIGDDLTSNELINADMDISEMRQVQLHLARKLQMLEYERKQFLTAYGIDLNTNEQAFEQQLENLRQGLDAEDIESEPEHDLADNIIHTIPSQSTVPSTVVDANTLNRESLVDTSINDSTISSSKSIQLAPLSEALEHFNTSLGTKDSITPAEREIPIVTNEPVAMMSIYTYPESMIQVSNTKYTDSMNNDDANYNDLFRIDMKPNVALSVEDGDDGRSS